MNGDMKKKLEEIRGWMEEKVYELRMLIGEDFNARTGKEGGSVAVWDGQGKEIRRELKDRKVNRNGRKLMKFIEQIG